MPVCKVLRWGLAQSQHTVDGGFALTDELHLKRPAFHILGKGIGNTRES